MPIFLLIQTKRECNSINNNGLLQPAIAHICDVCPGFGSIAYIGFHELGGHH